MVEIEVDINLLTGRLSPLGATDIRPLAGGASSLSYQAIANGHKVVVKVAPAGLEPVRNRDVLRQAHVLRCLMSTDVPVPRVLYEDPGDPPDVPPLFVMSFVDGASLEPLFDEVCDCEPTAMAARMIDAARVLAVLHTLDPREVGLTTEAPVQLRDEVDRWVRALRSVDDQLAPGWQSVAEALLTRQPPPIPAAIVHGDYRLGNLLAIDRTVTAVIDWEIWSLGDPRVDLGWFLINADPATYRRRTPYQGSLPALSELTMTYAEHLGHDVPHLDWFRALACFKSTATWSLIVKHSRQRSVRDVTAEAMAATLPRLLEQAARLLC